MKTINLILINTITFIITLIMNFLSSTGKISGNTVGEISSNLNSLITPSGYAFSIWGLIYFMLILFVAYQWYEYIKKKESESAKNSNIWFAISNLANSLWLLAWVSNYILLSVLMMVILLFSLIMLVINNRLEIWDAPVRIIFFVWWPICFYFGWVILATILNISTYLIFIGVNFGELINSIISVIILGILTIIYLILTKKRNLREASLIAVWGFIAIAVKQYEVQPLIAYSAIFYSVVLLFYSGRHAILNFETSPIEKIKRGEF